jgi:hypothetical protein
VTATSPDHTSAQTGVALAVQPTVTFSKAINPVTVTPTSVYISTNATNNTGIVTASVTPIDGNTGVRITPASNLAAGTAYYLHVTTAVTDAAGQNTVATQFNGTNSFTTVAATESTAPTVQSQSPANGATSQAVTVSPTVTFSEAMDANTINTNTVQLRALTGDAIVSSVVRYDTSSYTATIDPVASLSNGTSYYVWVSGAKDSAGNTMTAYTTAADQDFGTAAASDGTLAVTGVAAATTTMTSGGTYSDGGWWTMSVTAPTSEASLTAAFSNWVGSSDTLATANNMRIYSAQCSSHANATNAVTITAANTASAALVLDSDLDSSTAGRQIELVVNFKVPSGAAGGSYGTTYSLVSSAAD